MVSRIRRPEEIGSLIRARRLELGLDQQALADRLGVSRPWVSEIENGKPKVQLQLVLRCMNELQIQIWAGAGIGPPTPGPVPNDLESDSKDLKHSKPQIDIDSIADMGLEKTPRTTKS